MIISNKVKINNNDDDPGGRSMSDFYLFIFPKFQNVL